MTPEDVTATAVATEIARGITDAVQTNARILASQRMVPAEAVTPAAGELYDLLSAVPTIGRGDLHQWSNRLALAALEAAAPLIAADALEPVYRWLVDDLAFPFDMHTDHKPAWLDVERLAAIWDAKDGEQPGTYLDAIYDETGWPRP